MGFFDDLADKVFKKDASGNTIIYPWLISGSGFIIDSEDKKNQIHGFYKKKYMIMLPAFIIIIILMAELEIWLRLVLLAVYEVWDYFSVKKVIKDLRKTEEKLKMSEFYANSAKSSNFPTLIFNGLTSLGFVAIGIWLLQFGKILVALLSIGFFGYCAIGYGYMIFAKIKNK